MQHRSVRNLCNLSKWLGIRVARGYRSGGTGTGSGRRRTRTRMRIRCGGKRVGFGPLTRSLASGVRVTKKAAALAISDADAALGQPALLR